MIKLLHLSDIHLGSGLAHGYINPATGLNTRLEDFVGSLSRCIDHALERAVDLVLFGGDAFPDATPPPLHQELFAQQFRRLADAGIPTVLLVGNHDQYGQGQEGTSLAIYRALGVSGFIVGDRLQTHLIETRSGPVQVTTLPWLNRSTLLTQQESLGLNAEILAHQLLQRLHLALEGEIRTLQPGIPAILLAHVMVETARYGAERHLSVGKGFTVPLSLLARPAFQYVALGHVHRHQVVCRDPLMIYPGSIDRVDFGEEKEEKGCVLVEVTAAGASYEFLPLPTRTFHTIRLDLSAESPESRDIQAKILAAIAKAPVTGSILRLIYRLRPNQLELIDERALHNALAPAFSYTIAPEVIGPQRPRLPGLDPNQLEPLTTLEQYLASRSDLAPLRSDLLAAARQLLEESADPLQEWDWDPSSERLEEKTQPEGQQLRLL
ncbi:exonuclease subunit SbcD [Synechococcus sp. Nb3U1]|uniref:metallophosphoesterase family protein n=1 Tax=Synechococcus sp. Nb3U1 TaxID=1914529 RepID=UPI001F19D249|nr:exonuclease subunit SbcD [Synechococcus sp. Nb3U1]MCF2971167.1 exonuclease subunit SbcD [Synechococcus sp. Nb3U1]